VVPDQLRHAVQRRALELVDVRLDPRRRARALEYVAVLVVLAVAARQKEPDDHLERRPEQARQGAAIELLAGRGPPRVLVRAQRVAASIRDDGARSLAGRGGSGRPALGNEGPHVALGRRLDAGDEETERGARRPRSALARWLVVLRSPGHGITSPSTT